MPQLLQQFLVLLRSFILFFLFCARLVRFFDFIERVVYLLPRNMYRMPSRHLPSSLTVNERFKIIRSVTFLHILYFGSMFLYYYIIYFSFYVLILFIFIIFVF